MQKYVTLICLLLLCSISKGQQTVGLFTQTPSSQDGYVLFAPISSDSTFLIDKCGYQVHLWTGTHHPGQSVYLLPDGNLLRPGNVGNTVFTAGGNGGVIEKFDWNSNLLWSYAISSPTECQHHDILQLPNGNVLAIAWELKTVAEAVAAGRNPSLLASTLWSEKIIEVQPTGLNTGTIVWEWHVWDHLIQDYDSTKANYGVIAQHPELINLNYISAAGAIADWLHCNALDYNPALDQIILSSHTFSEVWIIDHNTTTAEAASHNGGAHGKGGDLLYRWGNPQVYGRGTAVNKKLFGQHNPHWIPAGLKDAGKIMVFNNGVMRPAGQFSTVEIVEPPMDSAGNYTIVGNAAYLPTASSWTYTAPVPTSFFAVNISGAQRLSNGNTIICEGTKGNFFEIDSLDSIVWRYVNPVGKNGVVSQGTAPLQSLVFRSPLYEPGYSGFNGHTLTPGNPIELNPLSYTCSMLTGLPAVAGSAGFVLQPINPFSDEIVLHSQEPINNATLTLYDLSGRKIASLFNQNLTAGTNNISAPKALSPGLYFLSVVTSTASTTFKLMHN